MEQGMTSGSQVQIMKCLECYTRDFQSYPEGTDKSLRNLYAKGHGPYLIRYLHKEGNSGCQMKH